MVFYVVHQRSLSENGLFNYVRYMKYLSEEIAFGKGKDLPITGHQWPRGVVEG
jgi:hypothetical protein